MRKLITVDPLLEPFDQEYHFDASPWPARWVGPAEPVARGPIVLAFRRTFDVPAATRVLLHVTADERYELFLDGTRIGRGSERGDADNWFYETYDEPLAAGPHVLVAQVWSLGEHAPIAQLSVRPAFLLLAQGGPADALSTGVAAWDACELAGYTFTPPVPGAAGVGARTCIDGTRFPWGFDHGADALPWRPAAVIGPATIKRLAGDASTPWKLRPATLPAMAEATRHVGVARHVAAAASLDALQGAVVRQRDSIPAEAAAWTALLGGGGGPPVTVPRRTVRRVIVDLGDYYCAYGDLVLTGGHGALVRTLWAESLYLPPPGGDHHDPPRDKGDRDQVDGKIFVGTGGSFLADGGTRRTFTPLWWDAGRYVAVDVVTADEPLTVESYTLRTDGYPLDPVATFDAADARLPAVVPIALRALQMCSHETYMDCPYYEQLQYVGDSRLEVLTTYAVAVDARLPRKAVALFDASRGPDGWTTSRYPSRSWQRIPPFSLWWVCMVHDHALWRDDPAFVADRMPGVRAVLDAARRCVNADGLFDCPPGWNFVDWVSGHGWSKGIPPGGTGDFGVKGPVNWQAVIAFRLGAELETLAGAPDLAARHAATADRIAAAADAAFWDAPRGLLADDAQHRRFSEHSQCLAVIAAGLDAPRRDRALATALAAPPDALAGSTIYFTHYLFEACRLAHRPDGILDRMSLWFDLARRGLRTTPESPEPSRSDCHAWGAHPVFHFHATLLGVRPATAGFRTVRIEPQLGPLAWAKGSMPHPAGGTITCDLTQSAGRLAGHVRLPPGLAGELIANGTARRIGPGVHRL